MPNESPRRTLLVAVILCLVCSVLVSTAAVTLAPMQARNKELDRKKVILQVAGLYQEGEDIDTIFKQIEPKVVDLETGKYVDKVDANTYDQRQAASDPEQSIVIPPESDIASIRRRAKYASVYLVKDGEETKYIILPIHGYGLWSTMYGFLALESDANKVFGLTFYEHGETAGLGSEVTNPKWQEKWQGKLVFDDAGKLQLAVAKGRVSEDDPNAKYHVDGLAGATLTGDGVTNMLQYWLGDSGFGPYLKSLRS